MWVARCRDNRLFLYENKPIRNEKYGEWNNIGDGGIITLDSSLFPYVKWEDEPLEVDLKVTYNPNIKYYEIIKKKDFYLVIILSIGQTGEYWKYLLEDVKDCKVPIYFDFLYRNGNTNRLFVMGDNGFLAKAITTDRSLIKKLTQLTRDYFIKNKDKLKGSALTKSQLEEYGI